jgi:uncharacterized protein YndB with AHSA1/START domain
MTTWITAYADAAFLSARDLLMVSAARHGIDQLRPWGREALEQTLLYAMHRRTLDSPRGGGYWLWKPYIIQQTLREMTPGDLLIYSDAGVEIVADLSPLFAICRERSPIMLFANPYHDDGPDPAPLTCGVWTKRDCFVFMNCDEPRFHEAPLLDASFLVITKTPRAEAFIRDWLLYCAQPQLLNDDPIVCGLPNLPGYLDHRWDQSLLSLLACRDGLELFRQPSQHANHLKAEAWREPGEPIRVPYGSRGIFHNSPYATLLRHHRGLLQQAQLDLCLRRVIPATREQVFRTWTQPDVMKEWAPLGLARVISVQADVRVGGRYRVALEGNLLSPGFQLRGTYLDIDPPSRLVYSWPWHTQVRVEFADDANGTAVTLRQAPFPTEQIRAYHAIAWAHFLDRVTAAVGARATVSGGIHG